MQDRRGILNPDAAERHFRLTRHEPAPELAHLVTRHWIVEWDLDEPYTQEIVTHPSVNFVLYDDGPRIHGVYTGRFRQQLVGRGRVVATKFRPGGFHPFHPVPAYTLTNEVIDARPIFGEPEMSVEALDAALLAHGFEDDPRVDEIGELYRVMLSGEVTTVKALCAHAGYSARSLQRLFREYVGVNPKWILQRIRLHEAAERMVNGEGDWPRLALELGYFDQAHFIKAFKAVVGRSPADYAAAAATLA